MDKNIMENNAPASSMPVDAGRWVAVDQNNLGFSVPQLPNGQPVQGPDGALYCVGKSQDVVAPVAGNANNAIPTPSGIVQLPPIVQPIALVPYTSQNQPLLQYDPYSRPVEPEVASKAPVYVRKPYKGLSIAAMLVAILGIVGFLFLNVIGATTIGSRIGDTYFGYDVIAGVATVFNLGAVWYDNLIVNVVETDGLGKIAYYALPFVAIAIVVIFLILAIKYIIKLAQGKSPRCVSVLAIVNIILTILVGVLGLLAFKAEGGDMANVMDFVMNLNKPVLYLGSGVLVSFIASIALLILPLCAKKNAYMVEKDPSKETYVIK